MISHTDRLKSRDFPLWSLNNRLLLPVSVPISRIRPRKKGIQDQYQCPTRFLLFLLIRSKPNLSSLARCHPPLLPKTKKFYLGNSKKNRNGKYLFLNSPASILTSFFNGNYMFWLGINPKIRNSLICRLVFFWLNLENPVETLIHVCGF